MHEVLQKFFSPHSFRVAFPDVWSGFQLNLKLMVVSEILVLILALAIAVVRGLPGRGAAPFRALAIVYTDFFRGTPLILVAFVIGFGLPALNVHLISNRSNFTYGVIALTLVYTAYVTEVYRAGIESVHPSQAGAGLALGLTPTQTLREVILPQAVRRVVPPLLNDFISLQKDVALISILGPQEAFRVAQVFAASTFNYTPLLAAAALYLCVTIPLTRIVDRLQARSRRERGAALALGPR